MSDWSDLEYIDDNTIIQSVTPKSSTPEKKHQHPPIPNSPAYHYPSDVDDDVAEEMGTWTDDF